MRHEGPPKQSLATALSGVQILLGGLAGLGVGVAFGPAAAALAPLGSGYLSVLASVVLVYLVVSIIQSTARMPRWLILPLCSTGALLAGALWILILGMVLLVGQTFHMLEPERPLALLSAWGQSVCPSIAPPCPLHMQGLMLGERFGGAVLILSVLFGAALSVSSRKEPLLLWVADLEEVVRRVLRWLGRLAPLGCFALLARAMATPIPPLPSHIGYLLAALWGCVALLLGFSLPACIKLMTPWRCNQLLKALGGALMLALLTGSAWVTLPFLSAGVVSSLRPRATEEEAASLTTTTPLFWIVPTASLFSLLVIFYLAADAGFGLGVVDYIQLILLGIPAAFGSLGSAMEFLLRVLGLPQITSTWFLEIFPLLQRPLAVVQVNLIAVLSLLTFLGAEGRLRTGWWKLLGIFTATLAIACGWMLLLRFYS